LHHYRMYGLVVAAERELAAPQTSDIPDITIVEHASRRPSATPASARGYSYSMLADGSIHVSWSDLFDFVVHPAGARIDVYTGTTAHPDTAYTYLISQVISVALLQRGIESLHASAVELDGKAYFLIGESGFGKSTLTAALLRRGARVITDDLLVLERRGDVFFAVPGATRIKLNPQTAASLGVDLEGTPMIDGSGKDVIVLPRHLTVDEPVPVGRILILQPGAGSIALRPATAAEATHALLAATFNPLHTEPARLESLLRNARSIASATDVFFLDVPRDLTLLPDVIAAAI
jgi:hypothetical protein